MDVVGLASSILTFIDVAYKVVRGSYDIYSSATGEAKENVHVRTVIEDLERATDSLSRNPLPKNDPELSKLYRNCNSLSQDLLKRLKKLQTKKNGAWESFSTAITVLRRQKDVSSMEGRLDKYRQQILLRLLLVLCKEQSSVRESLKEIHQISVDLSNTRALQMEDLRNGIARALQDSQLQNSRPQITATPAMAITSTASSTAVAAGAASDDSNEDLTVSEDNDGRSADNWPTNASLSVTNPSVSENPAADNFLESLADQLRRLEDLMRTVPEENQVLRKLKSSATSRREGSVAEAVSHTFRWILCHLIQEDWELSGLHSREQLLRTKTSLALAKFLRENGRTFFIYGKPGCGKSSLMKFLGQNELVCEALKQWAGARKIVMVRVYFWRSTELLLRTLRGFYRSVLFYTLSQCPDLINVVFPDTATTSFGDAEEIPAGELECAFNRLVEHTSTSKTHRFCYFVDGLDELDDQEGEGVNVEHKALAELLATWAESDAVKVLCSARPHTIFLDVFGESGHMVQFHGLTRSDIVDFACSKFTEVLHGSNHTAARSNCLELVEGIVDKAEGVFLWAGMAVRSMLDLAILDDRKEALQQRLDECSSDLNTLIGQMLDRVDRKPSVRQRSNLMLYLAAHNPFDEPLNALAYSWLEEVCRLQGSNSGFPFDQDHKPYTDSEISARHNKVKTLLHQMTQGLLEMQQVPDSALYFSYRIDFFHRSVRDYLIDAWESETISKPLPSRYAEVEAYSRLRSAEANFVTLPTDGGQRKTTQIALRDLFESTFWWFTDIVDEVTPPFHCVEQLEDATQGLTEEGQDSGRLRLNVFHGELLINADRSWRWHTQNGLPCSFLHWAAYWRQGSYVRERLNNGVDLNHVDSTKLSLLLSASVGTDVELTRYLFQQGCSPSDKVYVNTGESPPTVTSRATPAVTLGAPVTLKSRAPPTLRSRTQTEISRIISVQTADYSGLYSVWLVVLRDFAVNVMKYCSKRRNGSNWPPYLDLAWLERFSLVLASYLEHGADPTISFTVLLRVQINQDDERCCVSLHEMLEVFKPKNQSSLEKLLASFDTQKFWKWLGIGHASGTNEPIRLREATADELLRGEWRVVGVKLQKEGSLFGRFIVRVF